MLGPGEEFDVRPFWRSVSAQAAGAGPRGLSLAVSQREQQAQPRLDAAPGSPRRQRSAAPRAPIAPAQVLLELRGGGGDDEELEEGQQVCRIDVGGGGEGLGGRAVWGGGRAPAGPRARAGLVPWAHRCPWRWRQRHAPTRAACSHPTTPLPHPAHPNPAPASPPRAGPGERGALQGAPPPRGGLLQVGRRRRAERGGEDVPDAAGAGHPAGAPPARRAVGRAASRGGVGCCGTLLAVAAAAAAPPGHKRQAADVVWMVLPAPPAHRQAAYLHSENMQEVKQVRCGGGAWLGGWAGPGAGQVGEPGVGGRKSNCLAPNHPHPRTLPPGHHRPGGPVHRRVPGRGVARHAGCAGRRATGRPPLLRARDAAAHAEQLP